ncbi:AP-3 complex subunit delta isoform X1 [Venturia canescens]|nr:AP-3 complex subunit delta isoform X1 [Venturia canescens]
MALRKVKGNFERMFDKNLTDLVRGIRNNKNNEAKYIAQCIEEIKQELRQDNIDVKANAVAKLTYLQMLGYDISWAGFNTIEVMSSGKFTYKRIGYLAASQSFHMDTELLMLTTNMIRKDLNSQNQYDAGLALSGLSCFISPDLARDLVNDIMTLLTCTKPYLRKKAVLMMYKVFLRFPEALRPAFPRLKEKLEDPDSGVQSAAVNVVCELARKNPRNYLSLAPIFFKLMTTSTNNWMLIKIIKLFATITLIEPKLGRQLTQPLIDLISSTSAMSLLYECINTVIAVLISISSGMPNHSDSIQLCVQKLRILIEDSDQNLKYLGLLAMSKILKTHPKSVQAHKDLIMQCLDDKDESIRLRALDLLYGMVSKKNLMEIVRKLMIHMDKAEGTTYRDELLSKIIQICSQNNYQFITYFEWYISILVDLTRMEGTKHGQLVATQLLDVAIRVQAIRRCAVQQCAALLENAQLLTGQPRATMTEVLYAAAWICGEFSSELEDPLSTLRAMLKSQSSSLPGHIQAVYVHNILKLAATTLAKARRENDEDTMKIIFEMKDSIAEFVRSGDLEVQERSSSALVLFQCLQDNPELIDEFAETFVGELNPVAPKAQRKVQVPDGLDLDTWINEPPSESSDSEDLDMNDIFVRDEKSTVYSGGKRVTIEPTVEEIQKRREVRIMEQENNPHYLKGNSTNRRSSNSYHDIGSKNGDDFENIPIAELDIPISLKTNTFSNSKKLWDAEIESGKKRRKTHSKKKSKKDKKSSSEDEQDDRYPVQVVNTGIGELPPGAELSDNDDNNVADANDPHRALNVDLDIPLRDDERLPVLEHRPPGFERTKNIIGSENEKRDKTSRKTKKKSRSRKNEEKLVKESKNRDTIDLWLGNDTTTHEKPESSGPETINASETKKHSKSKRVKSKKKERAEGDEKSKHRRKHKELIDVKHEEISGYEETTGISTPSAEILPNLNDSHEGYEKMDGSQSAYKKFIRNERIDISYELTSADSQVLNGPGKIVLTMELKNTGSDTLRNLSVHVPDTATLKLDENSGKSCGLKVLQPSSSEMIKLSFEVYGTVSQTLPGNLSYTLDNSLGENLEKLEFTIKVTSCDFLIARMDIRDAYSLDSNRKSLSFKKQREIHYSRGLVPALDIICNQCHLTLVEKIEGAATLYGRSIGGHLVCLLIKEKNTSNDQQSSLKIESTGNDGLYLSGIMEDIETALGTESATEKFRTPDYRIVTGIR